MKWLKTHKNYILEAKIRDLVNPNQKNAIINNWGEKYLDYNEINPTDKIKQGSWLLSLDDKYKVLGEYASCDIPKLLNNFSNLSDKFVDIINSSIDTNLLINEDKEVIDLIKDFDIKNIKLSQINLLYSNIFRKLSTKDTLGDKIVSKDENGKPILDEDNKLTFVPKEIGELVFSNNLVNITNMVNDYETLNIENSGIFPNADLKFFREGTIGDFKSYLSIVAEGGDDYDTDLDALDKDLYLSILHNPTDILNMSISTFYSSCQNLYTGCQNEQLLMNVFDPNSIPAFLSFNTSVRDGDGILSDRLPISRMIIRNIEDFADDKVNIYFDKAYPDRMKRMFGEMIEKYSDNKNTDKENPMYVFTPDVEFGDNNLDTPYHDRLDIERYNIIGVNTTKLYLSSVHDWSRIKIAENNNLKEVIVESTDIDESFFKAKLNLDWIKFRGMKLNDLSIFTKLNTDSLGLDSCKFNSDIFNSVDNIKRLNLKNCIVDNLDLSTLNNIESLELVYTLDSINELITILEPLKSLKSLTISGDLISGKEDRKYLNSLKPINVKIVGPSIK